MPALLEFIDVDKIWARPNTAEPSKISRMNTVKRTPSFWTNYLLGIYFLTIFFLMLTVGQNVKPIKSHIEEKSEAWEENMNGAQGKWLKEFLY